MTYRKRILKIGNGMVMAFFLSSFILLANQKCTAQIQPQGQSYETYGHTLNIGLGIGYYGYLGQSVPIVFFDYEFDVARNFTLAPFIGYASYQSSQDYTYGGYGYYYNETIVPVGVKGTYYLDRALHLNRRWDLYLAASLGYFYDRVVWQNGYYGDQGVSAKPSSLYWDAHIGAEYHMTRNLGLYVDLSTGVSSVGLAIHHL